MILWRNRYDLMRHEASARGIAPRITIKAGNPECNVGCHLLLAGLFVHLPKDRFMPVKQDQIVHYAASLSARSMRAKTV